MQLHCSYTVHSNHEELKFVILATTVYTAQWSSYLDKWVNINNLSFLGIFNMSHLETIPKALFSFKKGT